MIKQYLYRVVRAEVEDTNSVIFLVFFMLCYSAESWILKADNKTNECGCTAICFAYLGLIEYLFIDTILNEQSMIIFTIKVEKRQVKLCV